MATKDIAKLNGETSNLPVKHEEPQYNFPTLYREMTDWMNQWNRWFDNFFNRTSDFTPFRSIEPAWGTRWMGFTPAINVTETDREYKITAELPGIDEHDIDLSINKGALTIKGEKRQETEDKGKGYYRMERSYGTFQRTISLPEEIDPDKVEAVFNKGVLTVTVPKLPEAQTRTKKIPVKTEGK